MSQQTLDPAWSHERGYGHAEAIAARLRDRDEEREERAREAARAAAMPFPVARVTRTLASSPSGVIHVAMVAHPAGPVRRIVVRTACGVRGNPATWTRIDTAEERLALFTVVPNFCRRCFERNLT